MKKENINLLENYLLSEKKRKNTGSKGISFIAVFLATVLILSAYSLKLFLEDSALKEDNASLQSYVSDPSILAKIESISTKQRQITDLNNILTELKSLNAAFNAWPVFDSVAMNKINSCIPADTKILDIDFDGQWFTLRTTSSNYLRPSEFARNLRNTGFFEDVVYYGYEETSGKYVGTVMVALKVGQ
jgi:Tfp pilus assembly protein PilN